MGDVVSELQIIREQLKHPNVVRYYKTFVERKSTLQHLSSFWNLLLMVY